MTSRRLGFLFSLLWVCSALLRADDFLPRWDAGYRGEIPDVPVVVSVSAQAIETEGHPAIQTAIDGMKGPGAVLLPAGTFELHGPIALRSGIVLRGAGAGKTHLKFHPIADEAFEGPVRPAFGAIRFEGHRSAVELPIASGFERGSTTLQLNDTRALAVGQMILVYSENDPELMYTDPRWNADWAMQSLAQIVEIVGINHRTVTLDVPLRLTYRRDLRPRLQIIDPIQNAGVEDLTTENLDHDSYNLIGLENARNCWVRRCETIYTTRGHIWVNFSRFVTIAQNEVHHSFSYGGGGAGYGIVAGNVATDCLYTDNILHHLRHAMMAKRGSNGNVFSYNYSFERRRDPEGSKLLCDISLHGHYSYQNLFEGNVAEFVELGDYWGPTGPLTTFLRNQIKTTISLKDRSDHTVFLGNHILGDGFQTDGTSTQLILGGNVLGGDSNLPSSIEVSDIPASAYRTVAPANWEDLPWPVLSSESVDGLVIPAQRRWSQNQRP